MRHHLHIVILTDRQILGAHARWMAWNLTLALIPLVLALALFRPGRRRGLGWWAGVVAFVGFLPNAPYVLTDVIHLVADVRHLHHPSALVYGVLPLYGVFFAAGFACYVVALGRLRRYLREEGRPGLVWPSESGLHALAAVGVFLGRFDRLNSWDLLQRPRAVVSALLHLAGARPAFTVAAILVVIAVATSTSLSVGRSLGDARQRLRALSA
jgi:uncharacterized membrane protein